MAVEKKRACGFRKVGNLYLVGDGLPMACDRLPMPLPKCPIYGNYCTKFSRGFTWVEDPYRFFKGEHYIDIGRDHGIHLGPIPGNPDEGRFALCLESWCVVCRPDYLGERVGLLWVGEKYYTPGSFIQEAKEMGISKRVHSIPRKFILGESWVLLAHIKGAVIHDPRNDALPIEVPAIFYAFKPQRLEMLVTQNMAKNEEAMTKLQSRGIKPVIVPDYDKDHAA